MLAMSCGRRLTTATFVPTSRISEMRAVYRATPGDPSGAGNDACTPMKPCAPHDTGQAVAFTGVVQNCAHARIEKRQGVAGARGRGLYRKLGSRLRRWSEGGRRDTTGGRCGPSRGKNGAARCRRATGEDKTGDGHAALPRIELDVVLGLTGLHLGIPATRLADSMGCTYGFLAENSGFIAKDSDTGRAPADHLVSIGIDSDRRLQLRRRLPGVSPR